MYGTCETLCRELAAQYPGDTHLPETASILAQVLNLRGLVHRF